MPDPKASPRYYLYSGDVTQFGARVSTSDTLSGPWTKRDSKYTRNLPVLVISRHLLTDCVCCSGERRQRHGGGVG